MGYSNCNPCDPCGTNQNAAKAAAYARQANTYATNAENSWLEFNSLYLGAFAVAPAVDNEGNPLQTGALYWNSASNELYAWNGTVWVATNFNELTPFLATGTTAPRNLVTRTADVINVKDFGAVGDWNGVTGTNDRVAFQNAIAAASGKKIYIPAGRYLIQFTTAICFTPPANVTIEGDGELNTELIVDPQGFGPLSFPVFFGMNNEGIEFKGIKFTSKVQSGNNLILIGINSNNVSINKCTLDGSVTNIGPTISHSVFGISHNGTGTHNNFVLQNSKLTRLTYPFLKQNTATSVQNNLEITGNFFTGNYYNDCGLNSPNGVMNNVVIADNTFEDNKTTTLGDGTQALGVALASVSNVTISDNYFSGSYRDSIHIEENSDFITIEGNRFSVNNGGLTQCRCIEFNANDIGGVEERPNHITIVGNVMYQDGPAKDLGTDAIGFIFNSLSQFPASEIIVSNNSIKNFNRGIYVVSTVDDSIVIEGNIIESCEKGIALYDGSVTISNNITARCDIGVTNGTSTNVYETATISDHVFIDCTTNIAPTDTQIVAINPKFIFSEFTNPVGTSYKTLLPARATERIYGELTITIAAGSAFDRAYDVEVITWDGTNLTWNDTSSLTPSATPVSRVKFESGFAISASRTGTTLDVAIFNTSSRTGNRLQVNLNGSCMIQP